MELVLSDIDDAGHRAAVLKPLNAHNEIAVAREYPDGRLAILLHDAQGQVEGGLWAYYWWEWLKLDLAFIPAHRRGKGLGAQMLATLEHAAVARGCRGVWLSSFSVQAPGFYQKLGYRIIGRLPDRPPGHEDVFLVRDHGLADRPATMVVTDAPDPAIRQRILQPLRDFTDQRVGATEFRTLAVLLKDESGQIFGGLWGYTGRGWLFVELLGLPPEARGQGMGTRLMTMAMDEARQRGCIGVWLDTFSFQARPFYERLGFSVFGEINNYPTGHHRYFLARKL